MEFIIGSKNLTRNLYRIHIIQDFFLFLSHMFCSMMQNSNRKLCDNLILYAMEGIKWDYYCIEAETFVSYQLYLFFILGDVLNFAFIVSIDNDKVLIPLFMFR